MKKLNGKLIRNIVSLALVLVIALAGVISQMPLPINAMSGSGTIGDPYIITDVNDLQAMEDDADAYYELGNNIDAVATSTWNGGEGFRPIGMADQYFYRRPISDIDVGLWDEIPNDGSFYNKVNEVTADDESTYITTNTWNDIIMFSSINITCPAEATPSVAMVVRARNIAAGTTTINARVRISGTDYDTGVTTSFSSTSYANKTLAILNNPATGIPWTAADIANIEGMGIECTDWEPDIHITQVYLRFKFPCYFAGHFDGKGYSISNLYINRPTQDYVGLFGVTLTSPTIANVTLENVDITGDSFVAGILAYTFGVPTIDNCQVSGSISGTDRVGGIAGYFQGSGGTPEINNCSSNCSVFSTYIAGGIVGDAKACSLYRCCAIGDVDVVGGGFSYAGGVAGVLWWVSTAEECFAKGDVTATGDGVGGFVGDGETCLNCYAQGDVDGDQYVGGFVGVGGDETNCYSSGLVTGNSDVGGFSGNSGGVVTDCFWDTEASGQATSYDGTGKTTDEMQTESTFTDASWDFVTVWGICEAPTYIPTYPWLLWEGITCASPPSSPRYSSLIPLAFAVGIIMAIVKALQSGSGAAIVIILVSVLVLFLVAINFMPSIYDIIRSVQGG